MSDEPPPDDLTKADYALLWHLARRLQACSSLPAAEAAAAETRTAARSPAVVRAIEATVGPALEALHERERLRAAATRDPLTGLANRRVMEQTLDAHLHRAIREGRPLAVAVLDLDRFRESNRRHGHPAGDEILRAVARLIEAGRRGEEVACRYGGDEFVIIMPDAAAGEAEARLKAFQAALATLAITHDGRPLAPITASVGIAAAPADGTDRAALIAAADEAMYRAKQAGGHRICAAALSRPADAPVRGSRP